MSESTRVELDLPTVIVGTYGRLVASEINAHNLEDLIARIFTPGDILTIHIIAETTGEHRGVCNWIAPDSKYKTKCEHVKNSDGVCPLQESHDEKDRDALQPNLMEESV